MFFSPLPPRSKEHETVVKGSPFFSHPPPPRPERSSSPTRRPCPPPFRFARAAPGQPAQLRGGRANARTQTLVGACPRARYYVYECVRACVASIAAAAASAGGRPSAVVFFSLLLLCFSPFLFVHFIVIVPGRKRGKKEINTRAPAATTLRTTRRTAPRP